MTLSRIFFCRLPTPRWFLCSQRQKSYPECCGKADHRSQTSRTHHTDFASTSLAAVRRRVEFKIASRAWYTMQVLSSKVPGYLADDVHLASESSARSLGPLHSVTRVHSRFGDRCFAAAGPRIWNNLPASLRDKEVSCTEFRRQLNTFMFQTNCGASWLFWLLRLIKYSNLLTYMYLLTSSQHHILLLLLTSI